MQKNIRYVAAWIVVALLLNLSACAPVKTPQSDDILTQRIADPKRIPVTILVKSAFSINNFETMVEQVFPELDIIQVGNYTFNMGVAEYETRLKHDDLTDIVMTWPLETGEKYWEERLLDLSALPFTNRYNASDLNRISRDGKLYYLPGPSQIRAIVYNKTLFHENGWMVPESFEGFLALCSEIEQSGIRALQLGLGNSEVLDTAFVGYSLASHYATPAAVQWLSDYNEGNGRFFDHFFPALDTFQKLIDSGVLQPGDLKITYSGREHMIFNRECAMVEDSVLLARMGQEYNGCSDEFGLMPFFNPVTSSDWARLYPVCYIGLNKHLAESENKAKYSLVLRLMDYISSPEGQIVLGSDTGAMLSSLNGVPPPDIPEIVDLLPALEQGRYSIFPVLKNAQNALRKGLAGMVEGKLTGIEAAEMVDRENAVPPPPVSLPVIGEATEDFSMIETGSFITDAMREKSGCEIALFLDNGKDGKFNGKGVSGKLYQGPLTGEDLERILPDLRQNERGELWKITMSGADLLRTLEYAIPVDNNHTGWFYYFSGLRMAYAPAAKPGTRIRSISDMEGQPIDPKRLYSIAVMDQTVPEDAIVSREKTGVSIRAVLEKALTQGAVSPSRDGRFCILSPE